MHGSLLTFGNDTPLYGHPTGGLALTDMCVIHTGYSHNTSLQNRGYMEGGSGEEQPEQWKIWWREQEELEGMSRQGGEGCHSLIYSLPSFIFSLLVVICLFEVCVCGGGGTIGHNVVQYSEGRGCVGFPACHSR